MKVIFWASQREPRNLPDYAKQGDPELPQKIERELVRILTKHPDWRLIIRFHPNEKPRFYDAGGKIYISAPSDSLRSMLCASDVVVTMTSTVGLEARFLGCPLLTVDLSLTSEEVKYSEMGLSLGVKKVLDIEAGIIRQLSAPRSFPEGFVRPGKATNKVVTEIIDLLKSNFGGSHESYFC